MIAIDTPARMTCDEPGCAAEQPIQLALLGSGTLAFKPADSRWQVSLPGGQPLAPFGTRCPLHPQKIQPLGPVVLPPGAQIGPRGPRMKNGH